VIKITVIILEPGAGMMMTTMTGSCMKEHKIIWHGIVCDSPSEEKLSIKSF
jgi:hypothetical protein